MCAHLPAPRTVQVVGVCSRGCPVPGCVWEFREGNFPFRWHAVVGAPAVPRMENSKEESTQGSRRS